MTRNTEEQTMTSKTITLTMDEAEDAPRGSSDMTTMVRERRTWSSPHVRDIRYLIGRDGRRRIVGRLLGSNDWVQTDDLGATLDEAVWWRLSQAAVDHADRFEALNGLHRLW